MDQKLRIAMTMGDPAGVGPELALRLLADERMSRLCMPIVIGDAGVLRRVGEQTGLPVPVHVVPFTGSSRICREVCEPTVLDVRAIPFSRVQPGRPNRETGRASFQYVELAIEAALGGDVDAITTGPIHKRAWADAGIHFPGHTELLAMRTGVERSCMMLASHELTCSLVTTHVGLRDVPELLDTRSILDVIELSHAALRRMRGDRPHLVVCGLNPHAGEQGLFGQGEEQRIILPAVQAAQRAGIDVEGPLPADTAFRAARRRTTDGYICMYHDQGLIPLKALAFDEAVNVTLGLPFHRTSVDHGTACDIAWRGEADPSSLLEAVRLAVALATEPAASTSP